MSKKTKVFRKVGKRGQKKQQKAQDLVNEAQRQVQEMGGEFDASEFMAAGIPEDLPPNPYFDSVQEKIENNVPINFSENGLFHTAIPMQTIAYRASENEKVTANEGSYIVLGTDKPSDDSSGYGAMGSNIANSIDLVVGRMSAAKNGEGPGGQDQVDGAQVGNSFFADSARIHISQLTDIDKNFGLAQTHAPPSVARSGIGIKADAIRIVGREGIKIVSGPGHDPDGYAMKGETNSLGGKISQPAPRIDIIAGNNTDHVRVWGGLYQPVEMMANLQPVVKGYITRDAFKEISEILDEVMSAIMALVMSQIEYNAILSIDFFRPWLPPLAIKTIVQQILFVMNTIYQTRVTKAMWEFNYLTPYGYKYICSRAVSTT
tara:strand:+ start:9009 stop:10133 length:1125 start_codon:yes stop_codon:yes gene_type:complete